MHQYCAKGSPTNTLKALWCTCVFLSFPLKTSFLVYTKPLFCLLRHLSFQSYFFSLECLQKKCPQSMPYSGGPYGVRESLKIKGFIQKTWHRDPKIWHTNPSLLCRMNWFYLGWGWSSICFENMTGRRFHRTGELIRTAEAIPRRPWESTSPFASRPMKTSLKKGTQGVCERYDVALVPYLFH